jgi:homoserine O-acetyltransferase
MADYPTISTEADQATPAPPATAFARRTPLGRAGIAVGAAPIIATFLLAFFSLAALAADQGRVENQFFTIRDFALTNGTVMPDVKIAYETYGTLAPNGRNAVLITHGYTSTHHAAGRNPANGLNPGWWDGLIGPGKAIDTDKLFVVSSNALGSSAGSTNGASLNPATGKPYGSGFPAITMRDIVAAQKALLDGIGVKHLVAVAGPSYGGNLAFQWSVSYPEMMGGVVAVVTEPRSRNVSKRALPTCRRGSPPTPTGMAASITTKAGSPR